MTINFDSNSKSNSKMNSSVGIDRINSLPSHQHDLNPIFFLPRSAMIEPNVPAIIHRTRDGLHLNYKYKDFAQLAMGLGYYLKKNEKKYKMVAIIMTNTPSFLISIFGVGASGAISAHLNYRLKPAEIHYMLDLIKVDLILIDYEFLHLVQDYNPDNNRQVDIIIDYDLAEHYDIDLYDRDINNIKFEELNIDINNEKNENFDDTTINSNVASSKNVRIKDGTFYNIIEQGLRYNLNTGNLKWDGLLAQGLPEDSILSLAFTSGTTGKPKAVEYTHRNMYLVALCTAIESGIANEGFMGDTRCKYLWTLPIFHAGGWSFPYSITSVRGTHVCLRKINTTEIWNLLERESITHFCAAPTVNTLICDNINAHKLKQPVRVMVAASPPSATLFKQMISFNLYPVHGYGLTETFGPFTKCYFRPEWKTLLENNDDSVFDLLARQGYAFTTSLDARVVKENSLPFIDVECDGTEIGEIIVRGNSIMKGYYRDPEATAKAFKGGWFHTGDLAVMYPDRSIKIVDRGKDIIISGGENISSVAVENEIMKFPGVLECAVVAIPDEKYGERPKAYLTIRDNCKDDFKIDDLFLHLKENMGGFQVPKEIESILELPKTSTGKIRKNALRNFHKHGRMDI